MPASSSAERQPGSLQEPERRLLLDLARRSIRHGVEQGTALPMKLDALPASLRREGACFVTLTRHGQLRGCIGSLQPRRPLAEDAVNNAWAAAFCDDRFAPLLAEELESLSIHLSVLGPLAPIEVGSESALLSILRRGVDGVVVEQGNRRSTFLPQVWEHFVDARDFLRALRRKAGLPDAYDPRARYFRYSVEEFGE